MWKAVDPTLSWPEADKQSGLDLCAGLPNFLFHLRKREIICRSTFSMWKGELTFFLTFHCTCVNKRHCLILEYLNAVKGEFDFVCRERRCFCRYHWRQNLVRHERRFYNSSKKKRLVIFVSLKIQIQQEERKWNLILQEIEGTHSDWRTQAMFELRRHPSDDNMRCFGFFGGAWSYGFYRIRIEQRSYII